MYFFGNQPSHFYVVLKYLCWIRFLFFFGGILVVDTIEELYGLAYIYMYPHLSGCSLLFFGPRAIMMIRIAKDNGILAKDNGVLGDVSDQPLRPTFKQITAKIQYLFGPWREGIFTGYRQILGCPVHLPLNQVSLLWLYFLILFRVCHVYCGHFCWW